MKKQVFLASGSSTRRKLLDDMHIPYQVISHAADERACMRPGLSLDQLVYELAEHKMGHAQVPNGTLIAGAYIITADTLVQSVTTGTIMGKPQSRDEAIAMICAVRAGAYISTGLCVEKRIFVDYGWQVERRITQIVGGFCHFSLPESVIDEYLNAVDFYVLAGALMIDGYGAQFCTSMTGSYTAILGLPLAELRAALCQLGYYE